MSKKADPKTKSHRNSGRRGAPLRFDVELLNLAAELRNAGFSLKTVAARLGFHRNTITFHLRGEVERLRPWAFKRQPKRAARAERESVLLAGLKGSHRVHAAHMVEDLWELLHVVAAQGRKPLLIDLAKIRGECDEWPGRPPRTEAEVQLVASRLNSIQQEDSSTVRAFYRMQAMLRAHGIRFEKKIIEGEPSIRLEFNVQELAEFVRREVAFAGRVIEDFAERTGMKRRFRGR